jgi:hypothetical protein
MNMRTVIVSFCALIALALYVPQAKADTCGSVAGNLVANCGFETGDFTGWTLSGNDVPSEEGNLYGVEGTDPFPLPDGTAPNSGNFQAFFSDLAADPTTISQVLATVAGDQYTVSFYLAQQPVGPGTVNNSVDVTLGGVTVQDLSDVSTEGYTLYTGILDATSANETLNLTFGNDIGEFLLDDVSVVATPEPSALPLVAIGLVMAGWLYRRRAARAVR